MGSLMMQASVTANAAAAVSFLHFNGTTDATGCSNEAAGWMVG